MIKSCDICGVKNDHLSDYFCMMCVDCRAKHKDMILIKRIGSLMNIIEEMKYKASKEIIKKDVTTSLIQNHNCDGLCQEKTCDNKTTRFFKTTKNNVILFIELCDRHSGIIENGNFDMYEEAPIIECEEVGDNWRFYCVHCGTYHNHGKVEGHRCSHCTHPSPYKNTGYILKLKSKQGRKTE